MGRDRRLIMLRLLIILHLVSAVCGAAQSLTTTSIRSEQPLQILLGASPRIVAMQLTTSGDVQLPVRLAIGTGVGATLAERMRIGSIQASEGRGAVIDLTGTTTSTGLVVSNVGQSGTEHAGIVIQSASNGLGTGVRLGGPPGALRPTLGTGIDITGGTGIRYNALTAGTATALDIGGTVPPSRGVDVTVSGSESVAGYFRANMLGTAVVGTSQSSAYADPTFRPRVGVRGHAATNSAASADDVIGVYGTALRGGNGGSQTLSIGVYGRAESMSTVHAGMVEALRGEVASTAIGQFGEIAAHVIAPAAQNAFALVASGGGHVYLGSSDDDRPPALSSTMSSAVGLGNTSTTYVYDVRASGLLSARTVAMRGITLPDLARGATHDVDPGTASVIRVWSTAPGSAITGFSGGVDGRILVVINRGADLTLANEHAGSIDRDRITTQSGGDVTTVGEGSFTLWYDAAYQRWVVVSVVP